MWVNSQGQIYGGDMAKGDRATTPAEQSAYDAAQSASATASAQQMADIAAAKAHAKLNALKAMTPAQIQSWVTANVTNLAQAQDAISTLAVAVGILARRL